MPNRNSRVRHPIYRYAVPTKPRHRLLKPLKFIVLIVVLVALATFITGKVHSQLDDASTKSNTGQKTSINTTTPSTKTPTVTIAPVNPCASNALSKFVLVSVSQRHMWACSGSSVVYDSPVITGMAFLAADLTPVGTYHIYGKVTNTVLKGSDSTGSWNDPVSYWMPFLDNQYGSYGFHDATWRPANAFGNISPNSTSASHGCVETPLATAKWLYDWAPIGTTITIES